MAKANPKSETINEIPAACADEAVAVEFVEKQRWGGQPHCPHCESRNVYMMKSKNGERNARYLWKCKDCGKQYTVRIGTVFEDSRIPLRHWCYAFWRACTSKKGVSALEISRQCQISYKSALFLMHRIRYAMSPAVESGGKLTGTIEVDETYVGGKPRYKGTSKSGRGTRKTPVLALVERNGEVRTRPIADVRAATLKKAILEVADRTSRIITDEFVSYRGIGRKFDGGHQFVNHSAKQYVNGDITTNTVESFFAIVKRGINGIFHSVSKERLPLYLGEFSFRYNTRKLDDGERTILAIRAAEGKRLMAEAST